jgi:hypothetical protein
MGRTEFLRNLQTAFNVLLAQFCVLDDSDPLATKRSERDWQKLKATAPVWMSPKVVSGFEPSDFAELPAERLTFLTGAVAQFKKVAEQASGRALTNVEVYTGISQFMSILTIVQLESLDKEAKAIHVALLAAKKPFPDFVLGLDFTFGTDATGDDAVWIWVLVPDEIDPDTEEFREFAKRFPRAVWNTLAEIKSKRIPYVHFRPLSEAFESAIEVAA